MVMNRRADERKSVKVGYYHILYNVVINQGGARGCTRGEALHISR